MANDLVRLKELGGATAVNKLTAMLRDPKVWRGEENEVIQRLLERVGRAQKEYKGKMPFEDFLDHFTDYTVKQPKLGKKTSLLEAVREQLTSGKPPVGKAAAVAGAAPKRYTTDSIAKVLRGVMGGDQAAAGEMASLIAEKGVATTASDVWGGKTAPMIPDTPQPVRKMVAGGTAAAPLKGAPAYKNVKVPSGGKDWLKRLGAMMETPAAKAVAGGAVAYQIINSILNTAQRSADVNLEVEGMRSQEPDVEAMVAEASIPGMDAKNAGMQQAMLQMLLQGAGGMAVPGEYVIGGR